MVVPASYVGTIVSTFRTTPTKLTNEGEELARDCHHTENLEHREGVKFVEDAVERLALAVPLN